MMHSKMSKANQSFMGVPPARLAMEAAPSSSGILGAPKSSRRKTVYTFAALAMVAFVGASVGFVATYGSGSGAQADNTQTLGNGNAAYTPTVAPTMAPTVCVEDVDVIFLLDESLSIEAEDFSHMKTFVTKLVTQLETQTASVRYGLTMFDDAVRTEIKLGESKSTNAGQFKAHINRLTQHSGLTCTAGALQASFTANFGPLDGGVVDPSNTRLRGGARTVFLLITDGQPTASTTYNGCATASGNCNCGTTGLLTSTSVFADIKNAGTNDFPNSVIALGVGYQVEEAFLASISDDYFSASKYSTLNLLSDKIANAVTCHSGTHAPVGDV
jgi:uncharacterized protein YegL